MSNEGVREMWAERWGRPDPKIVCVGLNYAAHAEEQGTERPKAPVLFGKFANTMLWDGDPIVLGPGVGHVDSEAELALVIGERASNVPEASAYDVIEAYTCSNDVSARDYQFGDAQWFRGKNLDGFCPLGPALVDASGFDPSDVRVQQRLNGEVLQDARTNDLIFTIPVLVSYITAYITLEPGDLILTGTPDGVGVFRDPKITMKDGDVVEIEIDGIGVLRNEVRAERRTS
jgi:2-keto-4-pentenoate hydratase/2-oxohepta-3-ene-1,7-dioic acid hydratase in catechol pathway